MISRIASGAREFARDIIGWNGGPKDDRDAWFNPGQPSAAMAPRADAVGRAFDYPSYINTNTRPRSYEGVSFEQLYALADNCNQVRLAIETVKDQMAGLTWKIAPKLNSSNELRGAPDDQCREIEAFFQSPDGQHTWDAWCREIMEQMLVGDCTSIYLRRTVGGAPFAFELLDGATIVPKLDLDGRQPRAPSPAFQQVLKGCRR
jgi:hypothetical protein